MERIIECVPNISEGRNRRKIDAIASVVTTVEGVQLLHVDSGFSANRTVITFTGPPKAVVEAAFRLVKKAAEVIDMRTQQGTHPRIGATDVVPLVPISGITLEEVVPYAHDLGNRIGRELGIPGYFYEAAALRPERKNLAWCRKGEYEGLLKLTTETGRPDFGPATLSDETAKTGATIVGARKFLIAYNINLNTNEVGSARMLAEQIRESGSVQREGDSPTGNIMRAPDGTPLRKPGSLKSVKALGWFIEEFGIAQISLNLTDIEKTPVHVAFEEARARAAAMGIEVTGSELVGLIPLRCLTDAADFYLHRENRPKTISEKEKVSLAVERLGLADLSPFDPGQKIIEYRMQQNQKETFSELKLRDFSERVAANTPVPGGGCVSAYCAALGSALAEMGANLSKSRKTWQDRREFFSELAEKTQRIRQNLHNAIDEDARAYEAIMRAMSLPRESTIEADNRRRAIDSSIRNAVEVPLRIAALAVKALNYTEITVKEAIPASITDSGVGALFLRSAVRSSLMNIRINVKGFSSAEFVNYALGEANRLEAEAEAAEKRILKIINDRLGVYP